ncbi:hypothetical protein IQ26_05085 [Mesorhizobium tianshanense]|uniref:Uncharacterized protein n=1 Tax=Mesorhizobium tianshanense TaxID=39844 RepID=A0A562NBM7_9HYPH|nr:hypothetical protein IQ26_05085 [Mesorhizobium tianshanense]
MVLAVNYIKPVQIELSKFRQYVRSRRCLSNDAAIKRGVCKLVRRRDQYVEIVFFGLPDAVIKAPEQALGRRCLLGTRPCEQSIAERVLNLGARHGDLGALEVGIKHDRRALQPLRARLPKLCLEDRPIKNRNKRRQRARFDAPGDRPCPFHGGVHSGYVMHIITICKHRALPPSRIANKTGICDRPS